jgi:putative transposase
MTRINLTLSEETLHHLISGDDKGISMLLREALNQILEHQRTEQIEAARYERTETRRGLRNGYKPRKLNTRVGTLNLRVPQIRDGVFSTELFRRYQRSEQALVLALMEMVVNGVSTRKVARITEELCGTEFSASTVSSLCKQLDPIVEGWKNRSLAGQAFPFVLVDALVIKLRDNGRVRPHSTMLAIGINAEGNREILGFQVGDSESESSWTDFFNSLKNRGLSGIDLVVSDDHRGLVNAVQTCFQGVTWQRCQTHFTKNILDKCPKSLQAELKARLRTVFEANDTETARKLAKGIHEEYADKAARAVETLDQGG